MRKYHQKGFAIFEGTVLLFFILTVLIEGLSIYDRFSKLSTLTSVLDIQAYNSAVKPLVIGNNSNDPLSVNSSSIENYINDTVTRIAANLLSSMPDRKPLGTSAYRILGKYGIITFDEDSGMKSGHQIQPYITQVGGLGDSSQNLDSALGDYLRRGNTLRAIPRGIDPVSGEIRYLNRAVVVGFSATISTEKSPSRLSSWIFNNELNLTKIKIVPLRGDLE